MTRSNPPFGIIAGTGVTNHFDVTGPKVFQTEFGDAEVSSSGKGSYYLISRHGSEHRIPPHKVNYRANIACLHKLGVTRVFATSAVGSMNPSFRVGDIGITEQFIDFTKTREGTFFDTTVKHADMTKPYSSELNRAIQKAGRRSGVKVRPGLTYVCVEGPRFETAAEIKMFRRLGGDVVGMTGVPEVVLANEKKMNYSSIVVATNWGAGIQAKVSHEEVVQVMKESGSKVKGLILAAERLLGEEK